MGFLDAVAPKPEEDPSGLRRDRFDRPLIIPLPGVTEGVFKSGPNQGLKPYSRASSFGKQLEDDYNLVKWGKRQVARGMAVNPGIAAGADIREPTESYQKAAWDRIVAQAEDAAGSNIKSALGTAIHAATERVDRNESTEDMAPILRERAAAYWRWRNEHGFIPTSVEVFGVEDTNCVAGTWDRTGWLLGGHRIGDVKTNSSLDYAGAGYAVQLAEYAHMCAYEAHTGARRTHEEALGAPIDLDVGYIIHVDRNEGGPITLHRVDIATGWALASLVLEVKRAEAEGRRAIRPVDLDETDKAILRATRLDILRDLYEESWDQRKRDLAKAMAEQIRRTT